jgi:hypothetical protein
MVGNRGNPRQIAKLEATGCTRLFPAIDLKFGAGAHPPAPAGSEAGPKANQ